MKKGDWYHSKDCKHAKNHNFFASYSNGNVVTQLANEMVRENRKNVIQFAIVLHLLQQGYPVQKYEAIKPLYEFLAGPKNSKKHVRNDNFNWTMAEFHASRCDGGN